MNRRVALAALPSHFDLIVVGGGITGAGVLREASRTGAKVLLVEQGDFASGTSSGSSKLVHGGLRYLKTGQWRLTLESVRERQRLMHEAPGLVQPQTFLMPIYRSASPGRFTLRFGLWIYDRMSGTTRSRWLPREELLALEPALRSADLLGAMQYMDAGTDDARMVLRLILESIADGATALNYAAAKELLRSGARVTGVKLHDAVSGETREIGADLVVNATGAWADRLSAAPHGAPKLRPLRGSHFVFPQARFPIRHAVSWLHPRDRRPIFAYPWEGATLYGTTDLDHGEADLGEAQMTAAESQYLLAGLAHQFPKLGLDAADAISTYAAVRPVVASGKTDPSAESRETALWSSPGLVNLAGGKLTTFRVSARQILREGAKHAPRLKPAPALPVFAGGSDAGDSRLSGRLGSGAQTFLSEMPRAEQVPIAGTPYTWAELRWSARHEQVVHLGDLLRRRTRIGLVMPRGGDEILPRVKEICREELGWDDSRWEREAREYRARWQRLHAPR